MDLGRVCNLVLYHSITDSSELIFIATLYRKSVPKILSFTIVLTIIRPARVVIPLLSLKGLPCTPFGNADLLVRVVTDPESRRTFKNFLL